METLRDRIKSYLFSNRDTWVPSGELQRMTFKNRDNHDSTPQNVIRSIRRMEREKIVAVKYVDGHAHYKYLPSYVKSNYIPTSERSDSDVMFNISKEDIRRILSENNYSIL